MKHRGTKILSLLLTLVMVLGLMPGMSLTALAYDGNPYTGLVNTTTTVTFNGKPWYIIADNSTAVDAGTVTLLAADSSFGLSAFDSTVPCRNLYRSSDVKGVLDALTAEGGAFASVKDAIADTDLSDVYVTGAKLYLLNKDEAEPYANFNFTGEQHGCWWLRSPGKYDYLAAYVNGEIGLVNGHGNEIIMTQYGIRPALKLNLSKVTFDSNTNTFSLRQAGYSVTLSGGANATTSGGATSQTGLTGAMTTVTYTANSGNKFPETSNLYTTTNGITVTRTSDTVVTVSGTPTANVNITVPDAAAIPTYTVSFAANGGSGSMASVTVNAGSTYNLPACDFTAPTGKQFKAWSYDGKEYAVGTQFTINSDATFIAVWQDSAAPAADKYTVTYVANNGSGETLTRGPYEAGMTYTVDGCSFAAPEGKVFDCWQDSDGKTYKVGAPVVLNANLTLTAQWKDEEEQQGGSGESGHGGITGDIVFIGGGYGGADEWYDGGYAPQRAWKVKLAPMVNGSAALGLMTGESTTTEMYVYPNTTIYVFPNANPGFVLDKIIWSYIDGTASYDITEAKNFVMPAMDVVVYVTFKPLGS